MVFRLFISHSSPTVASRQRLRALKDAIEAKAAPNSLVQVLVDEGQIVLGDDWRRRIAFMLHVSHGGIVLLDDAALRSPWVLAEAAFLSLRHDADAGFVFIPISWLDEPDLRTALSKRQDVEHSLRDTAWDVVNLTAVHYSRDLEVDTAAEAILTSLERSGRIPRDIAPADRLAFQLAPKLEGASKYGLRELADTVGDARAYLTGDANDMAAMALVKLTLSGARLVAAREQMNKLGSAFPADRQLEILEELSPLPVDISAAVMLTRRRASGGYAHACLSTDLPSFTVPLYIRRAHLATRPPEHFAIENTLGTFDGLQASLREEWRALHPSRFRTLSDDHIDRRLNEVERDVYVWVAGPIDGAVLAAFNAAYPRVALLIHHSESDEPLALPSGVLPVTPPLGRLTEDAMLDDYEDAMAPLTGAGAR